MPLDILLVDDEPSLRLVVSDTLRKAGHAVTVAHDGVSAGEAIERQRFDLVLLDVLLPDISGMTLFQRLRRQAPDTDVILITGHGSVPDAVQALKDGATDYLTKPFEMERLRHETQRIAERRSLERELRQAKQALAVQRDRPKIIGSSPVMQRLLDRIQTIAPSDAPVLVTGESGTGKELVARLLHQGSPRAAKPMITVNCAAFPETLLEAELFGHERGAFTGATKRREGRFKAAHGGTIFLDEVGEIPLQAQVKLLRVLQEGTFEPLGSNHTVRVNVRVISATHQPLKRLVAERRFREDLYYRLKVLDVRVPPLRERRGDLTALVEHFISRFDPERRVTGLTPRAWAALSEFPFPGNVRELEHAIQHGVVLAGRGDIDLGHLPSELWLGDEMDDYGRATPLLPLGEATRQFEREYLMRALDHCEGSRTRTASLLGISRKNLWEKLRSYGLQPAKARRDDD